MKKVAFKIFLATILCTVFCIDSYSQSECPVEIISSKKSVDENFNLTVKAKIKNNGKVSTSNVNFVVFVNGFMHTISATCRVSVSCSPLWETKEVTLYPQFSELEILSVKRNFESVSLGIEYIGFSDGSYWSAYDK